MLLRPIQLYVVIAYKAGKGVFRYLREFKFEQDQNLNIGDELTVQQFAVGDLIDVTGTSIGKGFQGVIKRHNFQGWACFPRFSLP
jgi:large subunit ribosomal protein L3